MNKPDAQPDGFLALPAGGAGAGVLVLHPWWGLNATIRAFCTRLAAAGFVVFAPDLYHGAVADTIDGAEALAAALDADAAKAEVAASAAFLRAQPAVTTPGLAVIGFSLGAYFALELSVAAAELVRDVVIFYGTGPGNFTQAQARYLGHFAADDPYEAPASVAALESDLRAAGRPVSFYHYPGTGHWFFEPDRREAFDPGAAELAWARTLAFLGAE